MISGRKPVLSLSMPAMFLDIRVRTLLATPAASLSWKDLAIKLRWSVWRIQGVNIAERNLILGHSGQRGVIMIRNPVVAGQFYPESPSQLKAMIEGLVDEQAV